MIKIIFMVVLLALLIISIIISCKKKMNMKVEIIFSIAVLVHNYIISCAYDIKFISWQNILCTAIQFIAFLIAYYGNKNKEKAKNFYLIMAIFSLLSIVNIVIVKIPDKGVFTKTVETEEKSTRTIPTVDPISKQTSIGYSIDQKGDEHYFYLEEKGGIMYYTPIKNPKIYYISGDLKEDTFVIVKTNVVTYFNKDRKGAPRWSEENQEYEIHLNSKDVCYIETN